MALSVGRSPNNHNAVEIRRPKDELTADPYRSVPDAMPPPPRGRRPAAAPAAGVSSRPSAAGVRGHVSRATPRRTPFGRGVRRSFAFFLASLPSKKVQTPSGRARGARPRGACAGHARVAHGMRTGSGLQLPKHPCASPAEDGAFFCSGLSLAALHVHVGAFVWNETCACRHDRSVVPRRHTPPATRY